MLTAFAMLPALIRQQRRNRRDYALQEYRRLLRKLKRAGISKAAHEGALEFSQRICQETPQLAATLTPLTELYYRVRYAPDGDQWLDEFSRQVVGFKVA